MYRIYTLDMFYILNFATVLWIYGTLNKMKWNDMKYIIYIICIKMTFMLFYSPVISWSILKHSTKIILCMCPAVHETDLNLLFSLQSCSLHVRIRRWLQWMLSVRMRIHTLVCRSMSLSICRFTYTHIFTTVAQWLRCCATNQKVTGSIPACVSGFFIYIKSFQLHYGAGVDSASNRNEYREYFLGVKSGRCVRLTTYHHPVPLSWNLKTLTSWNPLGLSRPVMGLL